MDLLRSTTHCITKPRRSKSTIPPTTNEANITHHSRTNGRHPKVDTPKELRTPTILETRPRVQQSRIKEIPPKAIMGPHHRIKTGSPHYSHQLKYMSIASRATRTTRVHQRARRTRNHPTIQESLHRRLLLYQKEEWKTTSCPRLPTHK